LPDSNGVFTMVVTATDPDLAFDTDTVVFTVSPVNDGPEVLNPLPDTLYITEDDADIILATDLKQVFHDVDGDTLSFSVECSNDNINLTIVNDTLFVTPEPDYYHPGVSFAIYAADALNYMTYQYVKLCIEGVNDPPELTSQIPDVTINEDHGLYVVDLYNHFSDVDDYSLLYEAETSGGGITVETDPWSSGITMYTVPDSNGIYPVIATAIDDSSASVSDTFNVTVLNVNDPPRINYEFPDYISYPEDAGLVIIAGLTVKTTVSVSKAKSGSVAVTTMVNTPLESGNGTK